MQSAKSQRSFIGINQLLDCSWSVILGERKISVEEFRSLVSKNAELIAVNDQWIELNPEKFPRLSNFSKALRITVKWIILDALRVGYGIQSDDLTLPVVGFSSEGWIKQLLNAAAEGVPKLEQPTHLRRSPLSTRWTFVVSFSFFFRNRVLPC